MPVPPEFRTPRLRLRSWRPTDAESLLPVLHANTAHLGAWIPARVAAPAPLPILRERLHRFADDFAAAREWRYAMFANDGDDPIGELSLFPRDATGRVPLADADRVELGYWLRADATGQGYATEAAQAAVTMLADTARFAHLEIRCDPRNALSAAVPMRLGFVLTATAPRDADGPETPAMQQIWTHAFSPADGMTPRVAC